MDVFLFSSNILCPEVGSKMLGFYFCSDSCNCTGAKDFLAMSLNVGVIWAKGGCTGFCVIL